MTHTWGVLILTNLMEDINTTIRLKSMNKSFTIKVIEEHNRSFLLTQPQSDSIAEEEEGDEDSMDGVSDSLSLESPLPPHHDRQFLPELGNQNATAFGDFENDGQITVADTPLLSSKHTTLEENSNFPGLKINSGKPSKAQNPEGAHLKNKGASQISQSLSLLPWKESCIKPKKAFASPERQTNQRVLPPLLLRRSAETLFEGILAYFWILKKMRLASRPVDFESRYSSSGISFPSNELALF